MTKEELVIEYKHKLKEAPKQWEHIYSSSQRYATKALILEEILKLLLHDLENPT